MDIISRIRIIANVIEILVSTSLIVNQFVTRPMLSNSRSGDDF